MRGRSIPLSRPRRLVGDLLHFARQVPSVPVQRRVSVAAAADARRLATPRPSWCAVFTKAYARVAAETPELRRAFLKFPTPHLYEHPGSVATVAVERHHGDENAVLLASVKGPDLLSLAELDGRIRGFQSAPLAEVTPFRRALALAAWPTPLRRLAWWAGLNVSGRQRARYFGTFLVSVYSGLGAESLHPLTPLTTSLNYGVIDADGDVAVRIVYDHRVLDGATVARALAALGEVLNGEVVAELKELGAGIDPLTEVPRRPARATGGRAGRV
jgi:hypothetical protein